MVALVVLREPQLLSLHDVAQVEMRVRDVTGGHPPLIGLPGRIEGFDQTGSHPGPVSFYALWPVYELLGGSAWALRVAAGFLSAVAAGLSVWIAHRRGGLPLALVATAVVAVLMRGYGADHLTSAWNPHMPLLWWWVFLLAVWSALVGDVVLLPVMVFSGILCAETHIPYVPLVAVLGLLGVAVTVRRGWRRALPWGAVAAGMALVFAAPPLVEQVTHHPGNVAVIIENFRHPDVDRASPGDALDTWLEHLDVVKLLRGDTDDVASAFDRSLSLGARLPALVLLTVWISAVVVAWRRRDAHLLWLHLLVGTAAATALVAITRILGPIWPYLVLSAWGITALMVLATLLTFVPLARGGDVRILAAVAAVALVAFAVDSASTESDAHLATAAGRLSARTAEQLDEDRTYLLRIVDPVHLASAGFGVALDLEKKGFDVRLDEYHEVAVRPHRIGTPDDADAVLRFVVGGDLIAEQQRHDDAELLAEVDPPGQEPPLAMFLEPVPSARSGVSSRKSYRGFVGPGCRSLLAETAGGLLRLGTPGDGDKRTTGAPLIPD